MTLVSIAANPVPENVVTGTIKTPDGASLRFARWAPPPGRKGTVCLLPGRAEFIEKYFETVRDLRARGFAVAMLDWRGQGLSSHALKDTRKGHVRDFAEYDTDLMTFMTEVVLPDCPPPLFAVGHSMGASVLLRAAYQGHRWFDRMVLSTPMIGLMGFRASAVARTVVGVLSALQFKSAYVPGGDATVLALKPFSGNILTSDPVRYGRNVALMETEPGLALGSPTVGWLDAAYSLMRDFAEPAYPSKIRQPLLIVAAGHDEVVSTQSTETFASFLRAGSHLVVPGARHELMMEQDRYRSQFLAAFDAFVPGTPLFG